ncbi:TonB-dependent receptor domain-containing protein [Sphingobacterium sp. LRF_L2]|uniref:TonB-dependent receptor n=1 Tax=Sphingobacterium sp. LRF_L2 TaxID=3369421 RepID=UPI003F629B0C
MNKFNYYVALIISLLTIQVSALHAQQFGVKGKVLDVETYKPIPGVSIKVANSSLAISTDENGEFSITLPERGRQYTLVSTFVGYNTDSTQFSLQTNNWEFVPVTLVNANSTLDEVVVTRRRERISEIALLEERKASNLMLEKIGAQELTRKGVSDAEGALTKMSGVTKSASGANVFVRGLGDRYNTTTFNGLALPSEDPLNKNISLDFFGTGIIQSVGVNKTFNAQLLGDVAGANIDILSKELSDNAFLEIGASAGVNTQAVKAKDFKRISGTNWFGSLKEKTSPITDYSRYSFRNNWDASNIENPVNSSFSLAGGRKFKVGDGNLDVFLTGGFNSEYRRFDGIVRQTSTDGSVGIDQTVEKSQYNVSKTGMANLKYSFNNHYIAFNSLYINDQAQDYGNYYGLNEESNVGDIGIFRRSHVADNKLYVNQLLSKINLSNRLALDLGVGYNMVKGLEPDRRTTQLIERDGVTRVSDEANGPDNERYYSDMTEKGWTGKAIATYKIENDNNYDRKIDFGYNLNTTRRRFDAHLFYHDIVGDPDRTVADVNNIDVIFNQNQLDNNFFSLTSSRGQTLATDWYDAKKYTHSALAVGTYQFNEKLTAVLGLRFDKVMQNVIFDTNGGSYSSNLRGPSKINKDYFLPSLNVKYSLTENSNLRAAASKSYTLPQFIEIAPFRQTFATYKVNGNPDLVPVENLNFDLKWELFPSNSELISVGTFYKKLKNPIARVETKSGGVLMTYFNVGATAELFGAEVELKKNLLKTNTQNGDNILSAGANVSYLYSKQELSASRAGFTSSESALQGASPLLVNADVSYLLNGKNWNLNSSVVFNYFSDRVYSLGYSDFQNAIEKAVPTLDFVTNAVISKKWGINLKVRNILNPSYEIEREFTERENITLESYKRGVDLNLGLSYRF